MKNTVVVGSSMGDESKGVFCLRFAHFDNTKVVCKVSGTGNCGHTSWINNKKYVLHFIPSGIIKNGIDNVIAPGVIIDPIALLREMDNLRAQGIRIAPDNLKIAAICPIITILHCAADAYSENALGNSKIGSTLKGSTPGRIDHIARKSLSLINLTHKDKIDERLPKSDEFNALVDRYQIKSNSGGLLQRTELINELYAAGIVLRPYMIDASIYMDKACKSGGVIFEGSQGSELDILHATYYPYCSSSSSLASYAATSCGISPHFLNEIVSVMKPYTSYVGNPDKFPFVTRMDPLFEDELREVAAEFGSTTNRPRSLGWLNLVELKKSCRLNGATLLAIGKLDVMAGLGDIKVCTSYTIDGQIYEDSPMDPDLLFRAEPNYTILTGWDEDISSVYSYKDLPSSIKSFVSFIGNSIGVPVKFISTGKSVEQMIIVN